MCIRDRLEDCNTDSIILTGGPFRNARAVDEFTEDVASRLEKYNLAHMADYLVSNYGKQTDAILETFESSEEQDTEVRLGLSELRFTSEQEAVHSLLDFFERRTGRLYFNIQSVRDLRASVSAYMSEFFQWTDERIAHEQAWLDRAIELATDFEKK